MEKREEILTLKDDDDQELPSLIKAIEVAGIDGDPFASPVSVSSKRRLLSF